MKKLFFVFGVLFIFNVSLFSESFEQNNSEEVQLSEVALEEDSDDSFFESEDPFDDLFSNAEDVAPVVQETAAPVLAGNSSLIKFSGHLDADIGLSGVITPAGFDPGGYLTFENYFYMNVRPNDVVSLHSSLYTSLKNGFQIKLDSLYFDYLFLNSIYISAGMRSVSWGYMRLFNDTDYYAGSDQYCNIVYDSGSYIIAVVTYPWATGTLSFVPMCELSRIQSAPSWRDFNFAGSLENTLFHTSVNLFARTYGVQNGTVYPVGGIELKRTFFGYDTYAQSTVKIADWNSLAALSGYEYFTATAGFYKLWDKFDPNFGINIEYQFVDKPNLPNKYEHKLAFEGGIKRIGKKKNQKIGMKLHHNFTEVSGIAEFAYIISGLFPYANWTNGCKVYYNNTTFQKAELATAITLDVGY